MANFKDYLKDRKEGGTALIASTASLISGAIGKELAGSGEFIITDEKSSEFSHKLSELATSDEVMNELSDEIGAPKNDETEDEFVERAKSALATILKRKLSKKI